MNASQISLSLLMTMLVCSGCVVSTHEGVGVAPQIPLRPERPKSAEEIALEEEIRQGPAEISAAHILIAYQGAMRAAPYVERTKEQALTLANELRTRAMAGEDFATMAQENSDDRGSAADGGSLGTFRREQMVPEFSKAAFALEVGDISEVVESPFGFHVIMRTP